MRRPRRPKSVPELFESQYALASDAQLAAAGVTPHHRARRLAEGDWRRPCPGVIQLVGAPKDWRQTPMAVTLGARESTVGLGAAVRVHGLDGFGSHELVDAFVERGARRTLPRGVVAHSSRRLSPSDITIVDGIRVTSIATTLLHCAAAYADERPEQALDDALRRGKAPAWFIQTIERWQGRGVRGPNELRRLLQSRIGEPIPLSWFQRLAQRALDDLGVRHEHEVPVYDGTGRRLASLDLADVELKCGLECQSWAHHATPAAQDADLGRKRRLTALGWEVRDMWWFDLDRMDAVYDDFQLARERQRRLLDPPA